MDVLESLARQMTPDQYCHSKASRSGSSFTVSFLFLPKLERRAITALYAFCREVDDVVDEVHEPAVARVKLDWWRNEVARLYAGDPQHPVTQALQPLLAHFDLAQEYLLEIIDGMAMDLDNTRYPDFKSLNLYCYRVASVVGLLSAEIFGYENRKTLHYARELGLAFQLTNILRDVREDAQRGRIYIPLDELQRFGVQPADLNRPVTSAAVKELFAFQAQRAREHYQRAFTLLPPEDRRRQRTGLVMAAIYATLLDEIEADGFRVLEHRISLPPSRKMWLALKTLWRESGLRGRLSRSRQ